MVMLPPNSDCRPPKRFPTMERERTVIPRTTPRLRTTLKPGSVRAVVTMASCMFLSGGVRGSNSAAIQPARPASIDSHQLDATRSAALDGHGRLGALVMLGDQRDQLRVGFAVNWS